MLLSNTAIRRHLRQGTIVIDPFRPENLGTASYDVALGPWFYRERHPEGGIGMYNPYDEAHVQRVWGDEPQRARPAYEFAERHGIQLQGIAPDDQVIWISPGETLLCHTEEFIGGRGTVTTMMKARSSMGRNFIEICKCLPPETEVRLASGRAVAIGDVKVGDELINVDRFGRSRTARVRATWRSRDKATLRLRTASGREFVCSPDHHLRVSRTDGVYLVEARSAQVGDQLPLLAFWRPPAETEMSADEATLLGYFTAEGHWDEYYLSFAQAARRVAVRDDMRRVVRVVFPEAPEPHEYPDDLRYASRSLTRAFAERYPELACLAPARRVPAAVFAAPLAAVRAFLAAYLAGDGHDRVARGEVETVSRSPGLVQDVALLAARLGAVPRFVARPNGVVHTLHHHGLYYGDDASRLMDRAPLAVHDWKVNVPDLMGAVRSRHGLSRQRLSGYAVTDRKQISRQRLRRIDASQPIDELVPYTNDLVWDTIRAIEASVARPEMVDISLDVESEEDSLFVLGNGLLCANCAGWGDVGFTNRWTMEVTNNSRYYTIPLVVGRRVAQIVFFECEPIEDPSEDYTRTGKYQDTDDLDTLKRIWRPDQMLPRMFADREARDARRRAGAEA